MNMDSWKDRWIEGWTEGGSDEGTESRAESCTVRQWKERRDRSKTGRKGKKKPRVNETRREREGKKRTQVPFCTQNRFFVCNEDGVHAGHPHRTWSPYTGQWTSPTAYHRLLSPPSGWCRYPFPFCRHLLSCKRSQLLMFPQRERERERQDR